MREYLFKFKAYRYFAYFIATVLGTIMDIRSDILYDIREGYSNGKATFARFKELDSEIAATIKQGH